MVAANESYDPECRARAAIGRAYYALFLAIRTEIRSAQGRDTHWRGDRIDHGRLPITLWAFEEFEGLAKMLEDLGRARRSADYELQTAPISHDLLGLKLCGKRKAHRSRPPARRHHYDSTYRGNPPSGDASAHAQAIMRKAAELDVTVLAVTDHNHVGGVAPFRDAAPGRGTICRAGRPTFGATGEEPQV